MKLIIQVSMLLWLCALAVEANVALKRRIRTMEQRMNFLEIRVNTDNDMTNTMFDSLHQDVDTLNGSFISLRKEVCLNNAVEVDNDDKEKTHISTEIKSFSSLSNRLLSLGLAKEKKWLRKEIQTLTYGIAHEKEILQKEVHAFRQEINDQSDRVDDRISEFKNVLTDHEVSLNIKLNTHMEAVNAKMQENLKKINQTVIDLEQNLGSDLSAVIREVSVIKTKNIQSLEEEIKMNTEIIKELIKLHKDKLTEKLVSLLPDCPDGWTRNGLFCYLYVKEMKTYDDARKTCSSLGASVADIQSKQENDFIVNFAREKGHDFNWYELWIGFTDEATENVWISDRTGTRASYTNWRDDQPDGGTNQPCVLLVYYSLWLDHVCSHHCPFVCKI